jgi:hypothetical protein
MTGQRVAVTVLAVGLIGSAGCATVQRGLKAVDRGFELASNGLSFASWQHFLFSARMTATSMIGGTPVAQQRDADTAAREGGWWGDPVAIAGQE